MIKKIVAALLITALILLLPETTAFATPLGSNLVINYDGDSLANWNVDVADGDNWTIGGTTSKVSVAGAATFTDLFSTVTAVSNGAITADSDVFDILSDMEAPMVTLSSSAPNPTNTSPIPVTITFNEDVTGFDEGDISVGNGTVDLGSLAGSGAAYTVNIIPTADGAVTVDVAADAAQDAAGNTNTAAAQLTRIYDTEPPTGASISINSSAAYATDAAVILMLSATGAYQMIISEDNSFSGASYQAYGTGRSFTLSSGDGVKTVYVKYRDYAGNETATINDTITLDTQVPTVSLSSTAADPTNTSPVPVTITFSEPVTGFTESDISVGSGMVAPGSLTGSGTIYTVNIIPTANGTLTVNIAAGAAQDVAGNTNTAAAQLTRTYDNVRPAVVLSSTAASTSTSLVPVTITFDEAVTGFDINDIIAGNGTKSDFSGSGAVYTVNIIPAAEGTVTVDIGSGAAQDAAGNSNMAAARLSINYVLPFNVTYYYNYDSLGVYAMQENVTYGSTLTEPASGPVRAHYIFAGWYKETSCVNRWNFTDDTATGTMGLYAKWIAKTPVSIAEAVQSVAYNGSEKAFAIRGTPAAGFVITYNQDSGDVIPVNVGTYNVVLTRAEDETYASYSKTITGGLVINPAATGGGGSTQPVPAYNAEVNTGSGPVSTLPVTVDKQRGSAGVNVGLDNGLMSDGKTAVITVPSIPGADTYTLGIPVLSLSTADEEGVLVFNTDTGSIAVLSNMLTGVTENSGSRAKIAIGEGDRSGLPDDVKAAIGDKPLIRLTLSVDGKQIDWNNPSAPVKVSIPYTPTAEELTAPENIVVWYIDGSGKAVSVPNGRYDPVTATVTFFTTHFSDYAVAYLHKSFSDLGSAEWAKEAIESMASKGIADGTDEDTFSPNESIIRADYIVWLVKTLGLTAVFDGNFDDVKPDDSYYEAVGVARKLELILDAGDNLFHPTDKISRQEMMMLAARALMMYQGLKAAEDNTLLDKFSDRGEIAYYATGSLATLVGEGLSASSGNKLKPRSYATRAEAAVFLYSIYNKYPNAPTAIASDTSAALPYPIAVPGNLKAASAGYNSVKFTWSPVAGAAGYELYRASSSKGKYTKLGETTSTNYTNKKLTTGKTYYYKVRAYRLVGKTKVYGSFSTVKYVRL